MKSVARMLMMLTLPVLMLLAGCGGGSDGGGGATVSGVAAAGEPLVGTVKLKDSSSPSRELTTVINEDGTFSFEGSGLTPPFVLKASGTANGTPYTLHSFATGSGVANVSPFTNLAVAMAAGGLDPASVYATPSAGILQTIAAKLPAAVTEIQTRLQTLLAYYDAVKINPLTDSIVANHTGLDEVQDMVSVEIAAGTVTVRNRATNAVIVSGPAGNPALWTVDASKIPVPPIRPVVSPIFTTVVEKGSTTFTVDVLRSANKKVSWSVVEPGGGSISDGGVYTAPATEGTYRVKAVSAANPALPAVAIVKVVTGQSVSVTINPSSTTLVPGGSKAFTSTVSGTGNTQVTWSVIEANGGNISASGGYTAPASPGTYHVKAVSTADPTRSATATVTVTASAPSPAPFPIGTWVGPNGFTFTITKLVQTVGSQQYYSGSLKYSSLTNGVINVTGSVVPDVSSGSSATIIGNGDTIAFAGIDSGFSGGTVNATSINAMLTKTDSNTMEGSLAIVASKIGASMDLHKAVFTRQ